jgi:hypothetical protein
MPATLPRLSSAELPEPGYLLRALADRLPHVRREAEFTYQGTCDSPEGQVVLLEPLGNPGQRLAVPAWQFRGAFVW